MPKTGDYKTDLLERLSDPEYAAGYLSACALEGQEEFLLGLRNVAQAQGGLKQVSEAANLNRESLYTYAVRRRQSPPVELVHGAERMRTANSMRANSRQLIEWQVS